jgi:hypothetical protein
MKGRSTKLRWPCALTTLEFPAPLIAWTAITVCPSRLKTPTATSSSVGRDGTADTVPTSPVASGSWVVLTYPKYWRGRFRHSIAAYLLRIHAGGPQEPWRSQIKRILQPEKRASSCRKMQASPEGDRRIPIAPRLFGIKGCQSATGSVSWRSSTHASMPSSCVRTSNSRLATCEP